MYFLDDFLGYPTVKIGSRVKEKFFPLPDYQIKESEKDWTISVVSPGLRKDDFELVLENKQLKLTMPTSWREPEKKENYYFRVPEYVEMEDVSAEYKSGILTVTVIKNKPPNTSFKIMIK